MKRLLAVTWLLSVSCSAAVPSGPSSTAVAPSPVPSPSRVTQPERFRFPDFDDRLPRRPKPVARLVVDIYRRLPKDIERWLAAGGSLRPSAKREVHRGALAQQRLYRLLVRKPLLARRVDRLLPRRIGRIVRRHVGAQQQLTSLATPVKPPVRWKTYRPESPHALRRYFRAGQRRFGVPWQTLAAVNAVESRFGRILGPSSAGALGPMQFMPSTWAIYGRGDIVDARDSIIAAARYLAASGAPDDMRSALFAYNRSHAYVDAILTYANEIERDDRSYYMYYFWEVFVRTTKGDVRLTGPKS